MRSGQEVERTCSGSKGWGNTANGCEGQMALKHKKPSEKTSGRSMGRKPHWKWERAGGQRGEKWPTPMG